MLAGQHPEVEVRTLDDLGRVVKTPLEYAEQPASVPRFEVRGPRFEGRVKGLACAITSARYAPGLALRFANPTSANPESSERRGDDVDDRANYFDSKCVPRMCRRYLRGIPIGARDITP